MQKYIVLILFIANSMWAMETNEITITTDDPASWDSVLNLDPSDMLNLLDKEEIKKKKEVVYDLIMNGDSFTTLSDLTSSAKSLRDSYDASWKKYTTTDIYKKAPTGAFHQAQCPTCNQHFKQPGSAFLQKKVESHLKDCSSDRSSDPRNWQLQNPTSAFLVARICPFYMQQENDENPCEYTKEKVTSLKSFACQCDLLLSHLRNQHPQMIKKYPITEEKSYLKKYILYKEVKNYNDDEIALQNKRRKTTES